MIIGGFQKVSLIDYPEKIAAVVFTQGCNFRCGYCHNPELIDGGLASPPYSSDKILDFLKTRIGKLDGVVITGGEPTLQKDLVDFIQKIKNLGFLVKLDTNGTHPEVVEELLERNLVDYIAMDIKAPFEKYEEITRVKVDIEKIKKSISIVMLNKCEASQNLITKDNNNEILRFTQNDKQFIGLQGYEFRTTAPKSLISKKDIIKIAQQIEGAEQYFIQNFVQSKHIDENFTSESYSEEELEEIRQECLKFVKNCEVR
jgi:pyruvate formate lyase activating enzyme